jgi:hypothetical protein
MCQSGGELCLAHILERRAPRAFAAPAVILFTVVSSDMFLFVLARPACGLTVSKIVRLQYYTNLEWLRRGRDRARAPARVGAGGHWERGGAGFLFSVLTRRRRSPGQTPFDD